MYAQRKEVTETCNKLHNLRTTVKYLTTDIKNLTSFKYLNEYEVVIQEAFNELFCYKNLNQKRNYKILYW